jgi:hypothetical protein
MDAVPAAAALVVALGEAVLGVMQTAPGIVIPFGVLAIVRGVIAVANVLKTPPKA